MARLEGCREIDLLQNAPIHPGRRFDALAVDQRLLPDQPLDVLRNLRSLLEELARVLAALAEARLAIRKECATLFDQAKLDRQVDQAALLGDALVVHNVEFGHAER